MLRGGSNGLFHLLFQYKKFLLEYPVFLNGEKSADGLKEKITMEPESLQREIELGEIG